MSSRGGRIQRSRSGGGAGTQALRSGAQRTTNDVAGTTQKNFANSSEVTDAYKAGRRDFSGTQIAELTLRRGGALDGANFSNAKMYALNLHEGSSVAEANFTGATIRAMHSTSADLSGAVFDEVHVGSTSIQFSDLTRISAVEAVFGTNAVGEMVDFTDNQANGADFTGTRFNNGPSFSGNQFEEASFERATANDAAWQGNNFTGANMARVESTHAMFAGGQFHGEDLATAADFTGADLRGFRVSQGTDMRGVQFMAATLGMLDAGGGMRIRSKAEGANFEGANFEGASFRNGNFGGTRMRGAILKNADIAGADFQGADWSYANLENLIGVASANLSNVNDQGAKHR